MKFCNVNIAETKNILYNNDCKMLLKTTKGKGEIVMRPERDTVTEVYEDRYKNDCYADVSYFINAKKRVIVCKVEPYVMDEQFSFFTTRKGLDYKQSMAKSFFEMCGDTSTSFVGKAVCMAEDEFDVEFGKRLAYDKAMFKLLDAKKKFFMESIKDLESYIAADKELIDDVDKQIAKTTERFEKKIKEAMA